jgi:hypothetical protein
MSRFTKSAALVAGATLLAVPLAAAATQASAHEAGEPLTIRLDPAKGSNGSGTATLTPTKSGGLKVHVRATGLVPNMPHAQHIHGDLTGHDFTCPTDSADEDGDGFITVEEGLPDYGGIHISLTTKGDTAPESGLAVDRMPVADEGGMVDYTRTLKTDQLPKGTLKALHHLHVVQHGVDANDNDEYDLKGLGESSFAKSLGADGIPEEATDVATCGVPVPAGAVPTGGESTTMAVPTGLLAGGITALTTSAIGGVLLLRRRRVVQA